jgi:hypothetical protein
MPMINVAQCILCKPMVEGEIQCVSRLSMLLRDLQNTEGGLFL